MEVGDKKTVTMQIKIPSSLYLRMLKIKFDNGYKTWVKMFDGEFRTEMMENGEQVSLQTN